MTSPSRTVTAGVDCVLPTMPARGTTPSREMGVTQYRSVLCVDASTFSPTSDMGMFKEALFARWPPDRLAQVVLGNAPVDSGRCARNWRVTAGEARLGLPGREDSALQSTRGDAAQRGSATEGKLEHRGHRRLRWLRYGFGDYSLYRARCLGHAAFQRWLKDSAPEVVFTFGGGAGILRMAAELSAHLRVPLLPCFTDDWASFLYTSAAWCPGMRRRLLSALDSSLSRAPVRLVASDKMAAAYAERFGGRFETCMMGVDQAPYDGGGVLDPTPRTPREVVVRYVGVLEPERWRALEAVGKAIVAARTRGVPLRLEIFAPAEQTSRFASRLNHPEAVRVMGSVPYAEVPGLQLGADILLHAEAHLPRRLQARTALSMSAKVAQYLAARRAVLAVGPQQLAATEYLVSSGAALGVDYRDAAALGRALERLATDPQLRGRLADAGREAYLRRHERAAAADRFARLVEESVASWSE